MLASSMLMTPVDVYNIAASPEVQLITLTAPFSGTLNADTIYTGGVVTFDRPFGSGGVQGTDYQVICNLSPFDFPDYNCVAAFPTYSGFTLRIMPIKNIVSTGSRNALTMRGYAYKASYVGSKTSSSLTAI
ncbi:hypothetical protein [Seinonella peptonophila]|nr:hypothetical protein [Seinonella peptonophila]